MAMAAALDGRRFLVTGGAGFIGSHLVERLLAEGAAVRVLDDLSTGKRANLPAGVELIIGDVSKLDDVTAALAGCDGCFHLAAIASVQKSNEEWRRTSDVNLGGAVSVFDAARASGRPPVVWASSAAVYGEVDAFPITEAVAPHPKTAYGCDKLAAELHGAVAAEVHQVPNYALRFFNVYGSRQDPKSPYSGVISLFNALIRDHRPVTIFGDGEQTRDFVHVSDVVQALCGSMRRLLDGAPRFGAFNVCTGRETSILALTDLLGRMHHQAPPRVLFEAPRPGDIQKSLGSPAALGEAIGFKAATLIEDGLRLLDGAPTRLIAE